MKITAKYLRNKSWVKCHYIDNSPFWKLHVGKTVYEFSIDTSWVSAARHVSWRGWVWTNSVPVSSTEELEAFVRCWL